MGSDEVTEGALKHLNKKIKWNLKFIEIDFNLEMLFRLEKPESYMNSQTSTSF